jgi:deoxyribose-phosphate aldolase
VNTRGIDPGSIAGLIEHTLLRPDASEAEILGLSAEAVKYGFHAVCVSPFFVGAARAALLGTAVKTCTVVGFPLGCTFKKAKVCEAREAARQGAQELDMVINIGALKSGDWEAVKKEISGVIAAAPGLLLKVIIEACYLREDEKIKAVRTAIEAGAGFIKTSTGMGPGGATIEDVRLIREAVEGMKSSGGEVGIKAAGGIKTLVQSVEFVRAGATRIGTSSGLSIVEEIEKGGRVPLTQRMRRPPVS